MTEETRKELLKMVKAEAEAARVAIRNIRKDGMNAIKQEPSEDDRKRLEKQVCVRACCSLLPHLDLLVRSES